LAGAALCEVREEEIKVNDSNVMAASAIKIFGLSYDCDFKF